MLVFWCQRKQSNNRVWNWRLLIQEILFRMENMIKRIHRYLNKVEISCFRKTILSVSKLKLLMLSFLKIRKDNCNDNPMQAIVGGYYCPIIKYFIVIFYIFTWLLSNSMSGTYEPYFMISLLKALLLIIENRNCLIESCTIISMKQEIGKFRLRYIRNKKKNEF